jgi:hypothetical protein
MLAIVGALLIGACNNAPSPSPAASPSGTAPASTAPSSGAPSASATAAACTGTDIRASGGAWGGAAGSRGSDIVVANEGSAPCLLPASPTIAVVDAGGTVLVSSPATAGPGPAVAPGGTVGFSLVIGNWCAQGTQLPLSFRLALAADAVEIGDLVVSSADELPPCNGPGQPPSLSATDWQTN